MNKRLTAKDRNMIKGAVRRAFSRSELYRSILFRAKIMEHTDSERPRVKTWYKCESCSKLCAQYELQVDHITPVIQIEETFEEMTFDTLIERVWCEPSNLQAICKEPCHTLKTKAEKEQRKLYKKQKLGNTNKRSNKL